MTKPDPSQATPKLPPPKLTCTDIAALDLAIRILTRRLADLPSKTREQRIVIEDLLAERRYAEERVLDLAYRESEDEEAPE